MTIIGHQPRSAAPLLRRRHSLWRGLLLLAASGPLLTLSFPDFGLYPLALVALTPFVLCIVRRPMTWRWLLIYYIFAVIWWNLNLLWLWPVTITGAVGLSFFVALYWALFAWAAHRLIVHLRWPAMLVVPVVWVATEYLRATLLTGFPWYTLGNALAGGPLLIQIADLGGVWGVSFFCGMTAGVIVDVLRLPLYLRQRPNPALVRIVASYLVVLAFVLGYGAWRLSQHATVPGPVVGVVQAYVPQDEKDFPTAAQRETNFQRYMTLSKQAAARGAQLIVWPETMVPEPINQAWLTIDPRAFVEPQAVIESRDAARSYDARLRAFSDATGAAVLVGAPSRTLTEDERGRPFIEKQNISVLYQPGIGQVRPYYAKRHLVMFGETIPFKKSVPWLHHWLLSFTPYPDQDVLSLTPGDAWTRYRLSNPGDPAHPYKFGTPICYEDVMPRPAQQFTRPVGGKKQVDFLATISNDGWYTSGPELSQHLQMDQLRAVENRVPIARSVNGGNSGFVDSDGRVIERVADGRVLTGSDGMAVLRLPLDRRVSLYSRIGDLFPILCGIGGALAVAWTVVRPRR